MSAIKIVEPIQIVSEGTADLRFIRELLLKRVKRTDVQLPFPNDKIHSSSQFGDMLSAIRAADVGKDVVKGVIIVADSCDDANATFEMIVRQIKKATGYAVPNAPGVLASGPGERAVVVLTIPIGSPGGLETLYYKVLAKKFPDLAARVEVEFSSPPCLVSEWNKEKIGKAGYATLVAMTHQDDPSRAASYAFRTPPTIDIESEIFDDVASALTAACNSIVQE